MARVLVVDDDESIRSIVSRLLRREGHTIQEAGDASVALEALSKAEVDVVVSDIMMTGMTGVQMLEKVRGAYPNVQVIMMTGEPTVSTAAAAVRSGAFDYLCKPMPQELLIRTVEKAAMVKALADEKDRLTLANKEYREHLESLVEERTVELQEANRKLQNALEELRQAQQQVVQQERLRALGEMASGVAHDFNNALSTVQGFAELTLMQLDTGIEKEDIREYVQLIFESAEDAAKVVARMRQFYRRDDGEGQFVAVPLPQLIQRTVDLTRPKWEAQAMAKGSTIDLKVCVEGAPQIMGLQSELREMLTNLIFNAVDAFDGNGRITIETAMEGTDALLKVADNGCGMTEEQCLHCFEPFYTSKADVGGTGLGLAVAYGVVTRHGGTISVHSQVGEGTVFVIRFPGVGASAAVKRETEALPASSPPCHILVVDDIPDLCRLVAKYLTQDGHDVDVAENGEEAIEKLLANTPDLVITDQAMPRMGGEQLAAEIKRLRPGTPVILLTGFGSFMAKDGSPPDSVDLVLSKPASLADLRRAITQVRESSTETDHTAGKATTE